MPYRGFPYFVTQSANDKGRVDLYASERHRLPNRVHGVRYRSAPQRAQRIKTYSPSKTTRPASVKKVARVRLTKQDIDLKRLAAAAFAMIAVVLVSAFAGVIAAQSITGYVDDEVLPFMSADAESIESQSAPRSSWKQGVAPTLYAADPQWADRPYGPGTMETAGAAALCLAMARIDVTGDTAVGPVEVASFSQVNGYANMPDATSLLTEGAAELGLSVRAVDVDELAMRREIVAGRPIIACVEREAAAASSAYIVIADIDERGRAVVNDPLNSDQADCRWTFDEVISRSRGMWSYAPAP